jgi:cullin-associated NEDD8-dissociated protein 1
MVILVYYLFAFCRSLGPLVNKVKEYQVETIVDALCSNMVSDKEQLRDISSIGLKTVISELPLASSALAANVCKRITGRLSTAIEKVSQCCHVFILNVPTAVAV